MMAGGRLRCLSCFFTCSVVLLLRLCPHDVEASSCQRVIHKKVGDTVELSSCLPTEGVTVARWKYGDILITGDLVVSENHQFKDRLDLNPTTFSLTVRRLTVKDSGNFSFVSEVNETQRKTVTITLHVHEPITKQPVVTSNSTWNASTKSCLVFLDCCATIDSNVTYSWTVGNQTIQSGSRLQHIIRGQDEETRFTCTIDNFVSEQSASETVKCSNTTQQSSVDFVLILSVAGGGCLMVAILVGIAITVCHHKQHQAGSDSNDLTVYADISEVANEAGNFSMSPCSVYETANRADPVIPGPQTVYDKIQLSRVRKPSVSPYQEVS